MNAWQLPRLRVLQRDVRTPPCRVARGGHRETVRGQPRIGRADRSGSVIARPFAGTRSMPASASSRAPSSTAATPRIGGVPAEATDAGLRVVRRSHCELVPLAEPAPDRLAELLLQLAAHVEECRRARSRHSGTCTCTRRRDRPRLLSSAGTEPTEWQRSHSTSAPASWASRVIAPCRPALPSDRRRARARPRRARRWRRRAPRGRGPRRCRPGARGRSCPAAAATPATYSGRSGSCRRR